MGLKSQNPELIEKSNPKEDADAVENQSKNSKRIKIQTNYSRNQDLRSQIERLQADNAKLLESNQALEAELSKRADHAAEMQKNIQIKDSVNNELAQRNQILQNEYQRLRNRVDRLGPSEQSM